MKTMVLIYWSGVESGNVLQSTIPDLTGIPDERNILGKRISPVFSVYNIYEQLKNNSKKNQENELDMLKREINGIK